MNRNHLFSFVVSTLAMWVVCYSFNSFVILRKVVWAKTFISPWLTYTTVMKYFHLGMGVAEWVAYILSAALLLFLWGSLYFFVFSLKRAMNMKR